MPIKYVSKILRFFYKKKQQSGFKCFGKKSAIVSPLRIFGKENISIGDCVSVHYKAWLQALPLTGNLCDLKIESGTTIGDFSHIVATRSITIERSVLIANHVYISDNQHGYEDVEIPIVDQPIIQKKDVCIGEGSWLGENVCVIGASVGKHCVIGANSVVTRDIPDYCVAVGSPARIIKRYDFDLKQWRKTDKNGNFV